MSLRSGAWLLAALGFVFAGFVSGVRADDKATATGTWKWEFQRPNGGDKVEITLKLKQEGDKLTGTISRANGNETAIEDGSVKDGDVSFKVTREVNGNTMTQKYTGKLSGDTIKGKVEGERNGQAFSRDWEAKRS